MQVIKHPLPKRRRSRSQPPPTFIAEPVTQSNSFVGTEEYIAPVCYFTLLSLDRIVLTNGLKYFKQNWRRKKNT